MMHYLNKALFGLFFLFGITYSNAAVVLVQNVNDAGVGSLRDLITNANPGDTILMNVKGSISLSSKITINKPLTIIGAYPIHSIINCSALPSLEGPFEITGTAGGLLTIKGFAIINKGGGGTAILIQGNSQVRILDCLFENNNGGANGQCIGNFANATGILDIFNCSFISNSSVNPGGAIALNTSSGETNIRNCTFYQNSSPNDAGAIYSESSDLSISNCTFLNNSATNGADIYSLAGMPEIFNNIFSNSNPSTQLFNPGSWNNLGGNVMSGSGAGQYGGGGIGTGNDFVGTQANVGIDPTLKTDGYGLKYFRINSGSVCIDNGVVPAGGLLLTDCKRAPRILYGGIALVPDAGAVEFTLFTVTTNNSAGFLTTWSNMNTSGNPGPKYMDFNIPGGPFTFNLSSTLENLSTASGTDWIVDGFTQQGSVVPGPGNVPNTVTPGTFFINISSSATPDVIHLNSAGTNSFIAGLSLNNSAAGSNAITIDGGSAHIYGNNITSSSGFGQIGINGFGSSSLIIGGQLHHNRNVIANEQFGLYLQNSYNLVVGNFIGTNNIGTASQPNDVGILAVGTTLEMKGKYRFPSMNLVSGNLNQQISIENLTNFRIYGNIIGTDYTGVNTMTNTASGIDIFSNANGFIGSGLPGDFNVIGGNSGGITIDGANTVTILGNYIGIAPAPGFPFIPNVNGITLISNGNHNIGDGTFSGRNYISGNSNLGIYADNTSGHTINGNFIGLNPDNNPAGNGLHGIWISNLSSNMNLTGNVIGSNAGDGIKYDNAGNFDLIQLNKIGTDSIGTLARSNSHGINLNNVGTDLLIQNNIVSGNNGDGIYIENTTNTLTIDNNTIGLDISQTAILPNSLEGILTNNSTGMIIRGNTVSGNGTDGIFLQNTTNANVHQNFVGTNSSNAPLGNIGFGIVVGGTSTNCMIGGLAIADGNKIAFNGAAGIIGDATAYDNGFLHNLILDNADLGIMLGITMGMPLNNDANDADGIGTAGNRGQNYPDNLSVSDCGGIITVSGNLDVAQAGDYIVQVFRINPGTVDASGHGEGNEFISQITLSLVAGFNPITFSLPPTVFVGDILSMTATYYSGTTYESSEFSDTVLIRNAFTTSATVANNVSCFGGADGTATVTVSGSTGPFSYEWFTSSAISTGIFTQNASLPAGDYYCAVTETATSCTIFSNIISITEPAAISISSVTMNVNCFGQSTGGVDITVTGGVGGFLFDWDNDGTGDFDDTEDLGGVFAGTYNVNLQDANGCTATGSGYVINQPGMISASPTVVNESCAGLNDGSITITAAGGTGSFNYQIDGGGFSPSSTFSGLAPGNYSIDVQDANLCVVNLIATVNAGENVIADFSVTSTTACQSAPDFDLTDISIVPSGTFSNSWTLPSGSPGSATNISFIPGVYLFNAGVNFITLQVTSNNGCTDDTTMTIVTNPAVFVDAGPDAAICLGDDFIQSATVSGGSGGNIYFWEPSAGHFVDNTIEDADVISSLETTIGYFEHILQVTDANGCTDRDTMYLDIRSLPIVNAGADNSICQGSAYTLAGSGTAVSYTWDNGVIDGSPFSPTATTTYTVIGTDATGCSNTDQVTIGVDLPVTVNAGPDLDECRSTAFSTTLNGIVTNASSVLWTTSGSGSWNNTTITNPTYFYSGADASGANVILTLIANSGNSCPNVSDDVVITFHNAPSAFAGPDFSSCSSNPISLSGGATDYSSIDWTNGTGTFSPDNLSLTTSYIPSAAEITAGFVNLNFTAYATNAACANASDMITITLLAAPVANAGIDASICNGQTYTLNASGSTGTISSYQWDEVGVGFVASTSTAVVSPVINTSYALTVGNGACQDSDTILITVVTSPAASFAYSTTAYCQNDGIQTPTTIITAGGTFTLPTSPGSINSATGDVDLSTLSAGVHKIYYTITTPCFAVDSVSLNIFGLPTVNAGGDTAICVGNSIPLNGTGSGSLFSWSGTNGFVSNVASTNDSPVVTTTYTLTVTDANSCTNTDAVIITVNAAPIGTISGGGTFCEGDPTALIEYGCSTTNNFDLSIFQNGTQVGGTVVNPPNPFSYLYFDQSQSGTYTTVVVDNITGCVDTVSPGVTITINPEPAMSVASPVNVCASVNSFDMDVTFIPNISGGVWSGTGVSGANFSPFSVGNGTFDVVYTVSTGCDDTIQIIVNPAPTVSFTGVNNAYCVTDPPFTPIGTPSGGLWAIDGGTFTSLTTIDPSTFSQGTHTISYQYTDGVTGCVGTTPPQGFIISNVPLDPIAVSSTSPSICAGTSLVLTVSNPNTTGTTVQWYSDAALTVNVGSTINFTTPALSSSIIYYAVAQNAGCKSNPVIFNITVNSPQVSAGADIIICPGTPAQLNVTSVSGTISWSPGISLDDSTIQNPLATPNVNTTYYVTVTSGPCSASDSVTVTIDGSNPDCGVVPSYNAFSPDGDGVNDTWIIDAIYNHPDNRVIIFNRWGDKLVSFEDYDNVDVVWDGSYKGEILPSGTYFYVIAYLDINIQVSGWLQLTR